MPPRVCLVRVSRVDGGFAFLPKTFPLLEVSGGHSPHSATMVGTRALVATALLATAVAAFEESDSGVLEHVRAAGGFVGFKIGKDCEGCIRGAFAAQDYDGE